MNTVTNPDSVTSSAKRRDAISPTPWRIDGQTIRDAENVVVMSALNPASMATRRLIVEAVNALAEQPPPQGNDDAMREALEFIKLASDDYEKYGGTKAGALDAIYEKACTALAAQPTPHGDAAAMREALEQVLEGFDNNVLGPIGDVPNDWEIAEAKRLRKVVEAALLRAAREAVGEDKQ